MDATKAFGAWAMLCLASGCAVHHDPGRIEGDGLAGALAASAAAGSARDDTLATCLDLASIAGTISGRGGWVVEGSLDTTTEGWRWSPEPADRLRVRVERGAVEVRCERLAIDPARGLHGDHDVRCQWQDGAGARLEVRSWRGSSELGGGADGVHVGPDGAIEMHLVHTGTFEAGETFEAIEGDAFTPGGTRVVVRQTLRRQDDRWGERVERRIDDSFDLGGDGAHRIDGAAMVAGASGWSADGKVLRGSRSVARLLLEPGPRVVWTGVEGAPFRVVVAGPPD